MYIVTLDTATTDMKFYMLLHSPQSIQQLTIKEAIQSACRQDMDPLKERLAIQLPCMLRVYFILPLLQQHSRHKSHTHRMMISNAIISHPIGEAFLAYKHSFFLYNQLLYLSASLPTSKKFLHLQLFHSPNMVSRSAAFVLSFHIAIPGSGTQ